MKGFAKNIFFVNLIFFFVFSVSCSKKNNESLNDKLLNDGLLLNDSDANVSDYEYMKEILSSDSVQNSHIDYDFSKMNYNMISSILFEILVEPESYAGKIARISGSFVSNVHEGKRSFSVIIWDATKCCPAGLSFIPMEGMVYPDDFPSIDDDITVTGTLKMYFIDGEDRLCFFADSIE